MFSVVLGQCTQQLKDKMEKDEDWTTVSTSSDPLALLDLIEKLVLSLSKDHYPFAVVHEQLKATLNFHQHDLGLHEYYERFKMKLNVGDSIGVSHLHPALLDWSAQHLYTKKYNALTDDEKKLANADALKRYHAYVFMANTDKRVDKIRVG